jgi:hypothetical protein
MFGDGLHKRQKVFAHRVVWMVLNQQDIPPGIEVNHKNGKLGETGKDNLELVTPSGNAIHAVRVLGRKAKLSGVLVNDIRSLGAKLSGSQIAELLNLSRRTVCNILTRKTFKRFPECAA